jgi:flavin reductase (DIM6/NTAB) family NADH-FMN oxidoreductase RutF
MRKNFGTQNWMYPLPVLIVASYDKDGKPNAMNAAWGGIYEEGKVILCLSEGHKTTQNIKATGAFTVSFADVAHVVEADYLGLVSGNNESNKL